MNSVLAGANRGRLRHSVARCTPRLDHLTDFLAHSCTLAMPTQSGSMR
jgi:hypothetical protein